LFKEESQEMQEERKMGMCRMKLKTMENNHRKRW
jgi:hypothetical protein